jgi:hypothetical protein
MIFYRPINKTTEKSSLGSWERRFALFPVCVHFDVFEGTKSYVWLEFYEVRLRYVRTYGWLSDYRRPMSQSYFTTRASCSK